jgi:parvulin-like peptidyl-prolyl isomerase
MAAPKKDEGAAPDAKPTDKNWADAKARAEDIKAELDGGGDFAAIARDRSDDPSKSVDGLLGWVQADDAQYGDYFSEAADAEVGTVVGPLKNDSGWYLLKVDDLRPAGENQALKELLGSNGISDETYRDYVRQQLLRDAYQDYFSTTVIARYGPQRHVSQIRLENDKGAPAPKHRIRHLLVAPLPGKDDQSAATAAQWQAALHKARELRREAAKPNADWTKLAKQSDDPGSKSNGGVLGWYDLAELGTTFVPQFANAVATLDIGEVSQPVRSDFGYHIIEVTDERTSALDFAQKIADQLKGDPDSFASVAKAKSEDTLTAADGGDLGWVIHYQLDATLDKAVFDLSEPGQISEPVVSGTQIYIFKLDETAEHRLVPAKRRESVVSSGFPRWIQQLKDQAGVWIDPEFAVPSTPAA